MNAPKINQTVEFEKPESAQVRAAFVGLKPDLASSAGPYSTHGASSVTIVTPIRPMAPPGKGSNIKPTITPAKIAKKYQACCAKPAGAGMSAIAIATTTGARCFHVMLTELSFFTVTAVVTAVTSTLGLDFI